MQFDVVDITPKQSFALQKFWFIRWLSSHYSRINSHMRLFLKLCIAGFHPAFWKQYNTLYMA